ncbi:MAG: hypothetical protein N3J91_06995 [Verrucomicrobiae bacterium]|nr:hypothetical protein [Verrucomicrobiae bacterium]
MNIQPAEVQLPEVSNCSDPWGQVSRYALLAARFMHASLACQAMAGFILIELRKNFAVRKPGRPSSSSISAELDWEDACFDAGISATTAWRWMKLAQAIKPRLRRLGAEERLRELINSSPSTWNQDETDLVFKSLEKITDGKTQLDFLSEIGLAKRAPGGPGGARKNDAGAPAPTPALAPATDFTAIAIRDWGEIQRLLESYDAAAMFSHLNQALIQAQCAVLETALQARRRHLIEK